MSFVGVDIGGTYVKAAAFDASGRPTRVVRTKIPWFLDGTGAAREIDPSALDASVHAALGEVGVGGTDVEGVLVTGQMAGIAFVDGEGRALAPLVSWQDTRIDRVDQVASALGPGVIASLGDGLRVGLPLVTLSGLTPPRGAYITSLIAYVSGHLAQTRARRVHVTDAASWGMVDVASGRWSQAALRLLGLHEAVLPTVVSNVSPVGTRPGSETRVYCAVGDQQASLIGAGLSDSMVSVNIATGGQVSKLSRAAQSPAQLRPYFDGRYLQTVTHLPAGRLFATALEEALGRSPAESDWAEAAHLLDSGGEAPVWIRSVVDRIVSDYTRALELLGLDDDSVLMFSGGIAQRFPMVRERIADSVGCASVVFEGDDSALSGLGVLSGRLQG